MDVLDLLFSIFIVAEPPTFKLIIDLENHHGDTHVEALDSGISAPKSMAL